MILTKRTAKTFMRYVFLYHSCGYWKLLLSLYCFSNSDNEKIQDYIS